MKKEVDFKSCYTSMGSSASGLSSHKYNLSKVTPRLLHKSGVLTALVTVLSFGAFSYTASTHDHPFFPNAMRVSAHTHQVTKLSRRHLSKVPGMRQAEAISKKQHHTIRRVNSKGKSGGKSKGRRSRKGYNYLDVRKFDDGYTDDKEPNKIGSYGYDFDVHKSITKFDDAHTDDIEPDFDDSNADDKESSEAGPYFGSEDSSNSGQDNIQQIGESGQINLHQTNPGNGDDVYTDDKEPEKGNAYDGSDDHYDSENGSSQQVGQNGQNIEPTSSGNGHNQEMVKSPSSVASNANTVSNVAPSVIKVAPSPHANNANSATNLIPSNSASKPSSKPSQSTPNAAKNKPTKFKPTVLKPVKIIDSPTVVASTPSSEAKPVSNNPAISPSTSKANATTMTPSSTKPTADSQITTNVPTFTPTSTSTALPTITMSAPSLSQNVAPGTTDFSISNITGVSSPTGTETVSLNQGSKDDTSSSKKALVIAFAGYGAGLLFAVGLISFSLVRHQRLRQHPVEE